MCARIRKDVKNCLPFHIESSNLICLVFDKRHKMIYEANAEYETGRHLKFCIANNCHFIAPKIGKFELFPSVFDYDTLGNVLHI